jgi:DNA-binding HxlR family transcriptional regulator
MSSAPDPRVCSIEAALRVIGEKWTLLIVRELMMGCTRYAEIVHNTGLPRDILTRRLRSLERAGVIYRHEYHDKPTRYDYRLAAAGEDLHGLLVMMRRWGDTYACTDRESTVVVRHSCAATLEPELRCAHCGEILHAGSVTSDRELRRSQLPVDRRHGDADRVAFTD